jgi:hypothetical protein
MHPWSKIAAPTLLPGDEQQHVYMLIDGAQVDRVSLRLKSHAAMIETVAVFGQPLAPDRFDATPHLLLLRDQDAIAALMRQLQSSLGSFGAISIIVSPLPLSELAIRLRARLDARLPDQFDCINRYFDGRITPHLHACLSPLQQQVFFSVATQWWVLDHAQEWQNLPCLFTAVDGFQAPLELDEAQQSALIDACYPHTVIEHFMQSDEELLETVPQTQRYAYFRDALKAAAIYGIDGGASAVLFCTLALTRGAEFFRLPQWAAELERVKRGEISLQQALKAQHD